MRMRKTKAIFKFQDKVLGLLSEKLSGYYLGGGTALAKFYFHHRESFDLDFFTQNFSRKEIIELIKNVSKAIRITIDLAGEQRRKDRLRMLVFNIKLARGNELKVDFIEDWLKLIKPLKIVNGVPILSLEDIYLRKIYTITGTIETKDMAGRKIFIGKREEAKDFYDLYFLSHTFQGLSDFALKHIYPTLREALVHWFRTYNRMNIKTGLLELRGAKEIDYVVMERHFKKEIGKLIEKEIGL